MALAGRPSHCRAQAPVPVPGPLSADIPAPAPPVQGPFGSPAPAWFAGVEVGLFHALTPVGTFFTAENVKMDFTVEPRVEVGYRFDDGSAFRIDYRTISSSGTGKVLYPGNGATAPHLRLEVNSVDLDYVSGMVPGLLHEHVSFEAGLRVASKLLDSQGSDPYEQYSSRSLLVGAGPQFGVTSALPIEGSGFALFGRLDAALVFGGQQERESTAQLPSPYYPSAPPYVYSRWDARAVGDATTQFGVSWAGSVGPHLWLRAALGVEAEYVGFGGSHFVDFSGGSVHSLDGMLSVGPFFRCEIAY
jgi:hypothetical protein